MTPTDIPWNVVARDALANSRRWFPHLHDDDFGAIVHFTLGLCGEAAELVASYRSADDVDAMALEAADVVTYTLDLGAMLGLELEVVEDRAQFLGDLDAIVIAAGLIANVVKKANRGDSPMSDLRAHKADLEHWARQIIRHADDMLFMSAGTTGTLIDAIATKVAICEERWG